LSIENIQKRHKKETEVTQGSLVVIK